MHLAQLDGLPGRKLVHQRIEDGRAGARRPRPEGGEAGNARYRRFRAEQGVAAAGQEVNRSRSSARLSDADGRAASILPGLAPRVIPDPVELLNLRERII